jgi:hypothetical protein
MPRPYVIPPAPPRHFPPAPTSFPVHATGSRCMYSPMPSATTSAHLPPTALPGLRLPLGRRRFGVGAVVSVLTHGAVIALLLVRGGELLGGGARRGGRQAGGGGGAPAMNFFTLPAASVPTEIAVPAAPPAPPADLPVLRHIPVELPRVEVPGATLPPPSAAAAGAPGVAPGAAGGPGSGTGAGAAGEVGPGTGAEGGYIFRAQPRRVIPWPPKCAALGPVEVRFWVAADGRPTRVELDPPPPDDRCRREFVDLMMGTSFYPARQNGQPVASVYSIRYSRGN